MEFFSATSEAITSAAREAGGALASGAGYVGGKLVDGGRFVGDKAVQGGQYAWGKFNDGVDYVDRLATAAGDRIVDGVQVALTAAQKAGRAAVDEAVLVYDAAAKGFKAVKVGATIVLCEAARLGKFITLAAWNEAVNQVASGGAYILSNPDLDKALRELAGRAWPNAGPNADRDGGTILAQDCQCAPPGGIRPEGCQQPSGRLPKAHYVNGINTDLKGHCDTLKNLAKALCKEMTGTYNATSGIGKDVVECVDSIQRSETVPQQALYRQIMANLDRPDPQPMELYAHSQGGLITQHAILAAKNDLFTNYILTKATNPPTPIQVAEAEKYVAERLAKVKVNAFGTAVAGWPTGPAYESYTNLSDPVPRVILSAQMNHMAETFGDSQLLSSVMFMEPRLDPFEAHSMDKTYIPRMVAARPTAPCLCPNQGKTS